MFLSTNKTKPISHKLKTAGSIIFNCLIKYVYGNDFNLSYIINYYTYITLFKIFTLSFSPQLKYLCPVKDHQYNTRTKNDFMIKYRRVNACNIGFDYMAISLWNNLPSYIKKESNLIIFKNKINDYLSNLY